MWLSDDKMTSYLLFEDNTWQECISKVKKICKRYKTVDERASGYKIIKPIDEKANFYLAIGESKVLYKKHSFEYIETKGDVESRGSWIHFKRSL